jgi:dolichyl-phosphate-mannose-protein mannosyltransferase
MSSSPSLRKRGGKREETPVPSDRSFTPSSSKPVAPRSSEWDYRLAITILTVLAFITRFYKISYPDQVVFDEVHFGKVGSIELPYSLQCLA